MTEKTVGYLINLAAVVVAGWALYVSYNANHISQRAFNAQVAPAKLVVTLSDPIWIAAKTTNRDDALSLSLVAAVTVANDGMQQGCLSDLVAILKWPLSGDERRLRALYFMDPPRFFAALERRLPLYTARQAQFGPLMTPGKQQLSESVLFYNPAIPRPAFTAGLYTMRLVGATCASPTGWQDLATGTYLFETADITELLKGTPQNPESEERRNAVKTLKGR